MTCAWVFVSYAGLTELSRPPLVVVLGEQRVRPCAKKGHLTASSEGDRTMPTQLVDADPNLIRSFFTKEAVNGAALVNRQCQLENYLPQATPPFTVSGDLIAYASPDSTYAVTKPLVEGAKRSILIGIYDFTAGYMKELLLQAMRR